MSKFTYKPLQNSRTIDLDKNDIAFGRRLCQIVDDLNSCIACGLCSSTCTAAQHTSFNFRVLQTLIRRGESKNAFQEAQKCMLCGKCIIVCPRGINTRKVILAIRELTSEL